MNPRVMPTSLKKQIVEKYNKFIATVDNSNWNIDKERIREKFSSFNDFIMSVDSSNEIPSFLSANERYDNIRNQNLFEVFPELISYREHY